MPSRERNQAGPLATAGICAALFILGVVNAGLSRPAGGITVGLLIGGLFGCVIGLFWLRREFVSPDITERFAWAELSAFAVKETKLKNSVVYEVTADGGNRQLTIPCKDFATRLGANAKEQAYALSAIRKDIQDSALRAGGQRFAVAVPNGLGVAPMPKKRKTLLVTPPSVVQR